MMSDQIYKYPIMGGIGGCLTFVGICATKLIINGKKSFINKWGKWDIWGLFFDFDLSVFLGIIGGCVYNQLYAKYAPLNEILKLIFISLLLGVNVGMLLDYYYDVKGKENNEKLQQTVTLKTQQNVLKSTYEKSNDELNSVITELKNKIGIYAKNVDAFIQRDINSSKSKSREPLTDENYEHISNTFATINTRLESIEKYCIDNGTIQINI